MIDPALPLFQLGGRRGVDVLRYTIYDSPHLQCLLTQRLAGRPPFEKEKQIVGRKPPSISEVGAASPLQFLFVLPRFASPRCPDGTARRSRFEVWQDLIVSLVLFTGVSWRGGGEIVFGVCSAVVLLLGRRWGTFEMSYVFLIKWFQQSFWKEEKWDVWCLIRTRPILVPRRGVCLRYLYYIRVTTVNSMALTPPPPPIDESS